jgi:hypothetical protein
MFRGHKRLTTLSDTNWSRRNTELPSLAETFRLIREICAGNSSFLGTCVTSLEMIRNDSRAIREEIAVLHGKLEEASTELARLTGAVGRIGLRQDFTNRHINTFLGAANDDTSPSRVSAD